ncbi:MAG TPA: asparagine synthase (glutamine-hydrolyzing) [Gemmatimonadaceae bacterium]|nr:asparagine synthase (glutamine-hydrolyzing) [Gemmatimonadaceae bacterium]
MPDAHAAASLHCSRTMCGFVGGILRRDVGTGDVRAFTRAVRTIAHRGPDDERVVVVPDSRAVLAFRRLSIIDIAHGAQPMTNGRGQHLVFNGEIYNHRELRPALASRGTTFHSSSDTEVLLATLATDGVAGLAGVKGMFGFGLLDSLRGELLLARDRLGIKQLYYTETPAGFFFASEPKALLSLPGVRATFDKSQLPRYFAFRCVPSPATLFTGISRLEAGTVLRFDLATRRRTVQRYWSLPTAADPVPLREAVDRFEEALLESVRRRLVADVPVGAFLSGGLDSSLVVAAMHRLGHKDIQTFTATFPGSRDDEAQFARRVSERFGTRHHERPVTADDCLAALPRWTTLNDDLVADASSVPLLLTSDVARAAGCIVLLSGEGSDELFGGYGAHHKFVLLNRLARLMPARAARERLAAAAASMGLVRAQDVPRVREYFERRAPYMGAAALAGEDDLTALLGALTPPRASRAAGASLDDLCRFDFGTRIPDDLLVRTDRATMGASIEARVPFLDHDLVELVQRLPAAARMLPGISKTTPRALARRWEVPTQTILHRKIGFQLPIGAWFRGPMRDFWARVLRERAVPGVQYDEVARLYDRHLAGRGSFEEMLWRIAALESWHRRWVRDEPVIAERPRRTLEPSVPALAHP